MLSSRSLVSVVVVAVLSSAAQAQTTWYVDDDNCPGPGSGTPGDPYCSIQWAIDNAFSGDQVVVAPGTYWENINFDGKAIWLYSSDGPEVTIIDAQEMGRVVVCQNGEGPDTVVDGFSIQGGSGPYGGGMYNEGSDPTVLDCIFRANAADWGGGMYNLYCDPTVINCTFRNNWANFGGGGIYNYECSPTVSDSAFCGNSPNHVGGPVLLGGQIDMSTFCPIPVCPADTDGDGTVGILDFLALLGAWGDCPK
jgi:hypothetical protein